MTRRLLAISLTAVFILTALLSILPIPKASAAVDESTIKNATLTWANRFTIQATIGDQIYTFKTRDLNNAAQDPRSYPIDYKIQNYGCYGVITVDEPGNAPHNPDATAPTTANLDMDFKDPNAAGNVPCQNTSPNTTHLSIANPGNAYSYFFALSTDGGKVTYLGDIKGWNFTQSKNADHPDLYTRDSESDDKCQDIMQVNQDSTYRLFELTTDNDSGKKPPSEIFAGSCYLVPSRDRTAPARDQDWHALDASAYKAANTASPGTVSTGGSSSLSTGSDATPSLDCKAGYNPLNWLLCGMVKGMVAIINQLDKLINSLMSVGSPGNSSDPSEIFGATNDSTGVYDSSVAETTQTGGNLTGAQGYYKAWSQMRNLALGIMVIAGLVIIITQALGTEVLDAYTIRKVLPRLLIAAVGISLSWQLMQFMVRFSNELGYGVRAIIYSPFADFQNNLGGSGTGALVTIMGAGAIGALGIFGLLSFAATGALAVFIAVLILILREIVISVLIILAPVAIALYILPNTNKIYKIWYESFMKGLMMFPIIAAFLATGRVFAMVAMNTQTNPISQIIAFLAYIAPYFAIPFTLKFAGGALGTLGGIVNDRSRGGFDRLKNYRKGQTEERLGYQKQRLGNRTMQARAEAIRRLNDKASTKDGFGGGALRFAGRRMAGVGGVSRLESKMSAIQAQTSKEINDTIATGRDGEVRGLTVDRSMGFDAAKANNLARVNEDGVRQWKSLGGAWVNESEVISGQKRWGNDGAAQQAALSYEMRKAMTDEQVQGISDRYDSLADNQWNMTDQQREGAWIGSAFENQNQHLEYKHTKRGKDGKRKLNVEGFSQEAYEKKGSYQLSQMSGHTIAQLENAYKEADATGDTASRDRIKAVAETFMHQLGSSGGLDDEGKPILTATGGSRSVSSNGAGAVGEAVYRLANTTGVISTPPNNPQSPGSPQSNPPQQRGPSGSGLITPGDDGFNLPPSQQPRG